MLRPPPASDLAFASISRPPVDTDDAPTGDLLAELPGANPGVVPNLFAMPAATATSLNDNLKGDKPGAAAPNTSSLARLGSFRPPPRPQLEPVQVEEVQGEERNSDQQNSGQQNSLEYSVQAKAQMPNDLMRPGGSGSGSIKPGLGDSPFRRRWNQAGVAGMGGGSGLFRSAMGLGGTFRPKPPDAVLTYEQFEELRRAKEKDADMDEEELDSQWFVLPSNTYGAAIWATLILHIEAIDPKLLFKKPDDDTVPFSQTWNPGDDWKFGFTYLLDMRIGGSDFFDLENAPYICATPGSVQLISIGFFMCFMLGQVPAIMKNLMLIWTTDMVTDQDDGVMKAKSLLYSQEWMRNEKKRLKEAGILHNESDLSDHELIKLKRLVPAAAEGQEEMSFLLREPFNHRVRKILASVFPVQEFSITVYLLYVGCKYIFWVGFMSLEQEPAEWFSSFPLGETEGVWPWMSETNGVEEIIMGTLALQFIMDVDESLFSFVLPRSVQASVQDTRLKCFGWLPGKFKESDYRRLGQRTMEQDSKGAHRRRDDVLGLEKLHVLESDQGKEMFEGNATLYYRFLYDAIDTAVHCLGSRLLDLMQEREEKRRELLGKMRPQDELASQATAGGMSGADKVEKELMESEEFNRKGRKLYGELEAQLEADLRKVGGGEGKGYLQKKLLDLVAGRLQAVPPHDQGMPFLLAAWAHLNAKFDLHQELMAKKVRLRWLNLLPDATFIFFFTVIFVPVILVGLVRSKVGCYEYKEHALAEIPADGTGYWGGVGRLSPLMVFFVLCAGWRAASFLRHLYKLKKETQTNEDRKALPRTDSQLASPGGPASRDLHDLAAP